mmetsp:Transcript_29553/g.88371  ORF Transcript_29553/g.88371 Transcript_29553/m.88371 type:complete len:278 (-) Transcript_29553:46-879(-)
MIEAHKEGPVFTNAHQSMGLDRYRATMNHVRASLPALAERIFAQRDDVEAVFEGVQGLDNVGPFLAWQVVCDLLESGVLVACEDEWCMLGPGAKKGLQRCFGVVDPVDELDLAKLLTSLQRQAFSRLGLDFAFFAGRPLTLKNVEHCLCEFAKYRANGSGMRRFVSRAHLDRNVVCDKCKDPSDAKDHCLLLCDLCNYACHTTCLEKPLEAVPDSAHWLCPDCDKRWAASAAACPVIPPPTPYVAPKDSLPKAVAAALDTPRAETRKVKQPKKEFDI